MQPVAERYTDYAQFAGEAPQKSLPEHPPVGGIVAEYNPFHSGHAWMVQQLRAGGVHTVVCVLGGPFMQRAEPALLPTHLRARAALAGGVDLVLRLPAPWAMASAEGFARGGVGLLAALGCVDLLAFGAECPQIERLEELARALTAEEFGAALRFELSKGVSFAAARAAAAQRFVPGAAEVLAEPNNILAVEYIKALLDAVPEALRGKMDEDLRWRVVSGLYGNSADMEKLFMLPVPLALPRVGAAHDGVPQGRYASAGWLRGAANSGGVAAWAGWVPPECLPLYEEAEAAGNLLDHKRYEVALLSRLKSMHPADIAGHPGAGEGLENRLAAAAKQATTLEGLFDAAKSKRFAHSRVRRLALGACLGLPKSVSVIPPFAQVLAANGRGLALLRRVKEYALVPVSTSLARLAEGGDEAARVVRIEAVAEDLHAMWQKTPRPGGEAFTRPAALATK